MSEENKMIAVIRISGKVDVSEKIKNTLDRLDTRRKYSCNIFKEEFIKGMLKKVRDYVAYGYVDDKMVKKLVEKRGKGDVNSEKVVKGLKEGKKPKELGLKSCFRLHPPRGGINTKQHYPRGVLGKHEDISKLLERML